MTYNNESNLRSVEDVKAFFHHLVEERKVNFHPDYDFADYICYADKTPTFTKEEVAKITDIGTIFKGSNIKTFD